MVDFMLQPTIVVYRSRKAGLFGRSQIWRFRVLGGNKEIMAQSEGYPTRQHARRGADDLVAAIGNARIIDRG